MAKRPFHFHQLGYTRNPFGALDADEWPQVALLPPAVQENLPPPGVHMQLIGQKGSGKSSALRKLAAEFAAQGRAVAYEYVPEGQTRFFTQLEELDLFLLDEAQRLHWWARWKWLDALRNGRLQTIFSTHYDLRRHFARRGLELVTVEIDRQLTLAQVAAMLARRLHYFALPHAPRAMLTDEAVAFLFATFGADLREMEYFLYEVWQELEGVTAVTPEQLRPALAAYRAKP